MEKISIIIPIFNSENTIKETLNSLQKQTYTCWEAICVDDGSIDSSREIITRYSKTDNRIKYVKRDSEQKGGSACRNIGASIATGDFLIFLDSDDVLAPSCVENRLNVIEPSEYDFVVFPIGYFDHDVKKYTITNNLYSKNHFLRFASGSPTWQTMQPIYRKDIVEKLGGFDARFPRYQDVEFGIRAMLISKYNIVKDANPDCFLRMSGNSGYITVSKAKSSLLATTYLLELLCGIKQQTRLSNLGIAFLGLYAHLIAFRHKVGITTPLIKDFENPISKIVTEELHGVPKYICSFIGNMKPSFFSRVILRILSKSLDIILDNNLLIR